ncbi:MAG: haloacid dehalogenase-like hydrolase [Alphaproteobacteria bacterium]|nr:haloacid dehalogenase-like hydrolase [Alphaproteobacteria bacterium]
MKKQNVVLFDFDGTLSAGDANRGFMMYCFLHSFRPWLFLPVSLCGLLVFLLFRSKKCASGGLLWRQLLRRFISADLVVRLAPAFIKRHKKLRFGWAKDRIAKERADGNIVLCVSAGPEYLLKPLVSDLGFDDVLCSVMGKAHPWKYEFLCTGKNKVVAVNEWAKRQKITPVVIRVYGDSCGDLEMMKLAKEQVWINSRTGKRIEAK